MAIEDRAKIKTIPCENCGRGFAKDRIDTHTQICKNQKKRKVFNIAKKRVKGTDAEALLKDGRLKLEPPRPNEKKSDLNKKLNQTLTNENLILGDENNKNAADKPSKSDDQLKAYQVVFDKNDKMKTKKNSKFPSAAPPPLTGRGGRRGLPVQNVDIDDRYLSAERAKGRWRSAATGVRPGIDSALTSLVDVDEDDYLNSSQKTVASDAFDFLFDSQNLNPERVLNHEDIERYTEEKMNELNRNSLDKNVVKDSACCTIS